MRRQSCKIYNNYMLLHSHLPRGKQGIIEINKKNKTSMTKKIKNLISNNNISEGLNFIEHVLYF